MFLNNTHRKRFAIFYLICFAVYYGWYCYHGLLLHQLAPVFFHNKLDITSNIIQLSDLFNIVIRTPWLQILFDALFLLLPLLLCVCCIAGYRMQYLLAILTAVFNLIYAVLLSSMSALSMEGFVSWMMLPIIFAFRNETSFYYTLQSMRYFFLLIFFSSAVWKIRTGAIFNTEQMSAILVNQHAACLVDQPDSWFSNFIKYLISHKQISYVIYLLATLSEFVFVIGFFTKRFDRLLIIIFLVFVALDYFLMGINYFSWIAFLGCLWFSRLERPAEKTAKG